MKRLFPLSILFVLSLMLQGCFFTGVESTPKITAGDVKREREPVTAEDTFLARVADAPLSDWYPGKEFVVTDSRISLIFGASIPSGEELGGKTITYVGADEATSVTGTSVTDLSFLSPSGRRLVYRINRPLARLLEEKSLSVPYTIQRSVIDSAASAMTGRTYYILTLAWRDDRDTGTGNGRKFVEVTIDSVTDGNSHFPLKASFTDGRGVSARIYFHPGAKGDFPRTFPGVFSFTDPRLRYPSIAPETWTLITEGRVAEGMTREECRLALGAPKEVERGATQSFLHEAWLYENGVYLLFEDGILKRYRR